MNIAILNKYIEKKQISILQLSKLCEMDDRNLGKIIHGKTKNPRIDTVVKIAKALKMSNSDFLRMCMYSNND